MKKRNKSTIEVRCYRHYNVTPCMNKKLIRRQQVDAPLLLDHMEPDAPHYKAVVLKQPQDDDLDKLSSICHDIRELSERMDEFAGELISKSDFAADVQNYLLVYSRLFDYVATTLLNEVDVFNDIFADEELV